MGIAAAPPSQPLILPRHLVVNGTSRRHRRTTPTLGPLDEVSSATTSMSQGFHQGIFSFDGLDRSAHAAASQPQHIAQQSRRDKLRVQGFDAAAAGPPLVPLDEGDGTIYEPTGGGSMLSDMFNFPLAAGSSSTDILASQIRDNYRLQGSAAAAGAPGFSGDWCGGNREGLVIDGGLGSLGDIAKPPIGDPHHQLSGGLTADSAAAMHLFLNPLQQQPPAPAPGSPPSPRSQDPAALQQPHTFFQAPSSFAGSIGGGVVGGQGLSLSLSSSLHHQLEMARTEELRTTDRVLYYGSQHHEQPHLQQYPGGQVAAGHGHGHGQAPMHHVGFTSPIGVMTMLRHSKYARAAQELLDEFCSVSRGQLKVSRKGKHHDDSANPNPSTTTGPGASTSSGAAAAGTSSGKDPPPLSPADRFEHQRKKAKLLSLLDEVERRYSHYCEQMQTVVNSFDSVMGFGAATPYTALAQKAMSRHFRCLKDAIAAQLKHTCDLLGEKDGGGSSGLTKGETPRLKVLEQSLRHQRAFHQIGMIEQEAWRPQRGLPERSVHILRSWLFEHFLHPYPSDADKHWLARQTGLTKNQVSNWFINARVRLWKPMVEDMYQQEAKDGGGGGEREEGRAQSPTRPLEQQQLLQRRQPQLQRPEMNAADSDLSQAPSSSSVTRRQPHHHQFCFTASEGAPILPMARPIGNNGGGSDVVASLAAVDALPPMGDLCGPDGRVVPAGGDPRAGVVMADYSAAMARSVVTRGRFGASGDVSLTLGLRQGGNLMETGRFSVGDFSDCS